MRHAAEVGHAPTRFGQRRIQVVTVRLQSTLPFFWEEAIRTVAATRAVEVEHDGIRRWGVIRPQSGLGGTAATVPIEDFDRGLVGLYVTAIADPLGQLFMDRQQQLGTGLHPAAELLAG